MQKQTFELISDLHKDARGFRPTTSWFAFFDALSYEDKVKTYDGLVAEMEASIKREKEEAATALAEFEDRLNKMVADYGITFSRALRWDMDANNVDIAGALEQHGLIDQEVGFYLYKQGISHREEQRYIEIVKKEFDI